MSVAVSPQPSALSPSNPRILESSTPWIPIDQAATLLAEPLRTIRHRAATQWAKRGLAELRPPPSGKGKHTWWLHRSVDPKLDRCPDRPTREDQARESLLAGHPHHFVERAYRRAYWLQEWRKRCDFPRAADETELSIAAAVVADAKAAEDDDFKIGLRSLQLWHKAYNELGPDGRIRGVEALVDRYGSSPILQPDGDVTTTGRSDEAVAHFFLLYRTENKLNVTTCHEYTLEEARRQGWNWPAGYPATTRWLAKTDNLSLSLLMRYGRKEWSHRLMPYLERAWEDVAPGDVFIGDHHLCDFWVEAGGEQFRPWLTAFMDGRTRSIVGWNLGTTSNQDTILSALLCAFRNWAVPKNLYVDNGKDFTAKRITGLTKAEARCLRKEFGSGEWKDIVRRERARVLCDDSRWLGIVPELNIDMTFALPYSPWSKPIERWFGTFSEQCAKLVVTYCGNSAKAKPECLPEIRAGGDVPTLEAARAHVGAFIERYHNKRHRGAGMNNRSPLEVWSTAVTLRRVDDDALAFMLGIRGEYKVGGNGVSVVLNGGRLSYGGKNAALRRYAGRKVLIAVDTHSPSLCFALDRDTRKLIGRLEPNERLHPLATHEDLRKAVADTQRAKSPGLRAQRGSAVRTRTMVEQANATVHRRDARLRATGTENARPDPNIAVVRTGFERTSIPDRTGLETAYCPADSADLTDLFDDTIALDGADEAGSDGIEDLFICDEPSEAEAVGTLEELL